MVPSDRWNVPAACCSTDRAGQRIRTSHQAFGKTIRGKPAQDWSWNDLQTGHRETEKPQVKPKVAPPVLTHAPFQSEMLGSVRERRCEFFYPSPECQRSCFRSVVIRSPQHVLNNLLLSPNSSASQSIQRRSFNLPSWAGILGGSPCGGPPRYASRQRRCLPADMPACRSLLSTTD